MNKSKLFIDAHRVAKANVSAIGNYMIAFSLALKSLYRKVKNMAEKTVAQLIELGGNEWKGYGKHRIYFNTELLTNAMQLSYGRYKTGNVSSATLRGEKISNKRAKDILWGLDNAKFFFDVATKKFFSNDDYLSAESHDLIVKFIEEA